MENVIRHCVFTIEGYGQNYPQTANGNDPAGVHAVRVKVVVLVKEEMVEVEVEESK